MLKFGDWRKDLEFQFLVKLQLCVGVFFLLAHKVWWNRPLWWMIILTANISKNNNISNKKGQVSISPNYNEFCWGMQINNPSNPIRCQFHQHFMSRFFCTKVFCIAFMCMQFGFVFVCKKKSAKQLLVKCWWNWLQEFWVWWSLLDLK